MRLEFRNAWIRLLVECCPCVIPMHRYRLARENNAGQVRRRMLWHIHRRLRSADSS